MKAKKPKTKYEPGQIWIPKKWKGKKVTYLYGQEAVERLERIAATKN
jgi:hypothetical protein